MPLDGSHVRKRHVCDIVQVFDLHVSEWGGKLRLLTLGGLLSERDDCGGGSSLTDERHVILVNGQQTSVLKGREITYEDNVWSPSTLRTDRLEDEPLLSVWRKARINRRHVEDVSKVILLRIGEAVAVENRTLDSAEQTLIELKLVDALFHEAHKVLAERQRSGVQGITVGNGNDVETVPWVLVAIVSVLRFIRFKDCTNLGQRADETLKWTLRAVLRERRLSKKVSTLRTRQGKILREQGPRHASPT